MSARDLRRLRALEGRLEKAEGERKSLAAERREHRARADAAERRVEALVQENARLAAERDDVAADVGRLRDAGDKLRSDLDRAKAAARESAAEAKRLQSSLRKAERERDRLDERLKLAEGQLKGKTTAPLVTAGEVARLLDGFVAEIGGGLPGLAVREGEVRLQVAFGKVGRATGFVVPSVDAPPEARKNLHEVAIRFDRALVDDELGPA